MKPNCFSIFFTILNGKYTNAKEFFKHYYVFTSHLSLLLDASFFKDYTRKYVTNRLPKDFLTICFHSFTVANFY